MKSLEGKVALVTGASSKRGMGHAIALRFVKEGADVCVVDVVAEPRSLFPGDEKWGGLDEVVKEVESEGRKGLAVVADISADKQVTGLVDKTVKTLGKIDILVNCAAIRGSITTPLLDIPEEDWEKMMDVNLKGTYLLAKAVGKHMVGRNEGGKMVLFGSGAGMHGVKNSGSYSVSKWGVIGFIKNLALELAPYNITVNGVNPGAIITNLRDEAFAKAAKTKGTSWEEAQQADYKMMRSMIPMGRLGTVEEIADLVYFLSSNQSSYITGEVIGINGGFI